jgi:hypothetical protein
MKTFVEKYETVIEFDLKPEATGAKEGEIVPHKKTVRCVYFFNQYVVDGRDVYAKVYLPKQMILDLFNEIQDIESQVLEKEIDPGLPF